MGTRLPVKLLWTLSVVLAVLVLVLLILLTASKISDVLFAETGPRGESRQPDESPSSTREEDAIPEPVPSAPVPPRVAETFRGDPALRGQQVVLGYDPEDSYSKESLYAIDLGTGRLSTVASDEANVVSYESLDVAADGEKLVYSDGTDLFIMNTDGTGLRPLFEEKEPGVTFSVDLRPSFSPDGRAVAFQRAEAGDSTEGGAPVAPSICVVNVDGSGFRQVIGSGEDGYLYPEWTSDGQGIVFLKEKDAAKFMRGEVVNDYVDRIDGLHVTDIKGAHEERFTDGAEIGSDIVVYSNTARTVAFRNPNGFYTMSASGDDREKVAVAGEREIYPVSWSPDGTELLALIDGDLFLVDPKGARTTRLTEGGTGGSPATWAP